MRIIAISALRAYWILNPKSKASLAAWVMEVKNEKWENSHDLKEKFRDASIITSKRVVFNIKGNAFRLSRWTKLICLLTVGLFYLGKANLTSIAVLFKENLTQHK